MSPSDYTGPFSNRLFGPLGHQNPYDVVHKGKFETQTGNAILVGNDPWNLDIHALTPSKYKSQFFKVYILVAVYFIMVYGITGGICATDG